jgi:hypothetical protein
MMDLIFSYNWNNKLDCNAFTTIRLYDPAKHQAGTEVQIKLKGQDKGVGTIKAVKVFMLDQLNDYIAYLDTGYDKQECENIIRRMYSNVDFKYKQLALLLIVKHK